MAGIKSGTTSQLMNTPVGRVFVQEFVEKEFTDPVKLEKIKQLWDAHDPVYHNGLMVDRKPAWNIQKDTLDTVLELQGYKKKKEDPSESPPVSIVFNTLALPQPVDVVVNGQ